MFGRFDRVLCGLPFCLTLIGFLPDFQCIENYALDFRDARHFAGKEVFQLRAGKCDLQFRGFLRLDNGRDLVFIDLMCGGQRGQVFLHRVRMAAGLL